MKTIIGNIFVQKADCIAVTTNGIVKQSGAAVMGRGIALLFKERWPGIDYILGELIKENGNVVNLITDGYGTMATPMLWHEKYIGGVPDADGIVLPWHIISFPTKDNWKDKSSLELIAHSMGQLAKMATFYKWKKVIIPRPGCTNGGLTWDLVGPTLERLLKKDNRFVFISQGKDDFSYSV